MFVLFVLFLHKKKVAQKKKKKKKNDGKANKYNIKRSLQGGQKLVCGKESVTASLVLKYFFSYSNSSKACAIVAKDIEEELLSGKKIVY